MGMAVQITQTAYDITYSSFGTKTLTFDVRHISGPSIFPYNDGGSFPDLTIEVVHCKLGVPDGRIINPTANSCSVPKPEGLGKLVAFIKYRYGGDNRLQKPVLIIEGLETTKFVKGHPEYDKGNCWGFGDLNWLAFSSGNFGTVAPQLEKFPDFADSIRKGGYDVVIADFHSNRAHIEKNANVIMSLIDVLNDSLQNNGSHEELVVIGASMGGLIGRYALRRTELHNCCHNVRLYASFSSPHRGANIPLGVQHFIDQMGTELNLLSKGDQARDMYDHVLNSPAAMQMLIHHATPIAAVVRNNFQSSLDSMGLPQQCRRISMTNGSGDAIGMRYNPDDNIGPFLNPNDKILESVVRLDVPLVVPDLFLGSISLVESVLNTSSTGNFTLINAKSYAVDDSPNQISTQVVFERGDQASSNFYRFIFHFATYATGNIVLLTNKVIHVVATAVNALSNFCILCPAVIGSKFVTTAAISAAFTSMLVINKNINENLNHPPQFKKYPTRASGPLDNVPADWNNTMDRIAELSDGAAWAQFPNHSFISSISALNLDTNDFFLDLNTHKNDLIRSGKIPFEAIWFNEAGSEQLSVNQRHVALTTENITWIVQKIQETHGGLSQAVSNGSPLALSIYYNYGFPLLAEVAPEKFLRSMTINSNGAVYVNRYNEVGFLIDPQGFPKIYEPFEIETLPAACGGTHVTIQAGGLFTVGDDNLNQGSNNSAQVYFKEGSKIEVENGGTLRINPNSRLVIEDGAEIIVHPGAVIDLNATTAILELQGLLTIKAGAILQTQGDGFIRFNQDVSGSGNWAQYQNYEAGAEIHFIGNAQNPKRAEVLVHTVLNVHLDSLVFDSATVEVAPNVFFGLQAGMSSKNSHFTSMDQNDMAMGVRTYGQEHLEIENTRFSHMETGLLANSLILTHPITVKNSDFDHCDFGMHVIGKNLTSHGNDFHYNKTGLFGDNIDGTLTITNTDFDDHIDFGFRVVGQNGSTVKMSGSKLYDNEVGALVQGTYFHAWCNDFIDNDVAISSDGSDLMLGKPQGHDNSFRNNRIDMIFYALDQLKLANGFNNFSGWYRYIVGSFSNNASNYLYYNNGTSGYELDVKDNSLPVVGTLVPVVLDINSQAVGLKNWRPLALLSTTCQAVAEPVVTQGITDCCNKTSFTVNTTLFNNIPLDSTVKLSIGHFDDGETTTLDHLKEIQEFVSAGEFCYSGSECEGEEFSELDVLILRDLYEYYLSSLSKAYENGHIELNRADPEGELSPYLDFIIQESDYRLTNEAPNVSASQEIEFYYNLSKAHAYRIGEHYDEALDILQNESLWNSSEEIQQADYWECVCEAERDLILENISPEQFVENTAICQNQTSAKRYLRILPTHEGVDVSDVLEERKQQISLAPNPSVNGSSLVFSVPSDAGEYIVYSVEGKVVARGTIQEDASVVELHHDLPKGYYTIRVKRSSGKTKTLKWIIH